MLLGLTRHIELELFDILTFQLDPELISHNVMVSKLEEKVCEVFFKLAGMLKEMEGLRKDKATLEVRFQGGLGS